METKMPGVQITSPSDTLREREQASAGAAVDELDAARGIMAGIRDNGGPKDQVMKKAAEANQVIARAQAKVVEVFRLREGQKKA